jgi:hypothetical protein
MKWQQVETTLRATLIPSLLLAFEKEYEMRQMLAESDDGMRWKVRGPPSLVLAHLSASQKVRLDGIIFPKLAQNVNR